MNASNILLFTSPMDIMRSCRLVDYCTPQDVIAEYRLQTSLNPVGESQVEYKGSWYNSRTMKTWLLYSLHKNPAAYF